MSIEANIHSAFMHRRRTGSGQAGGNAAATGYRAGEMDGLSSGEGWMGDCGRVKRVADCRLRVSGDGWGYARENQTAIETHWQQRCRDNPGFFNGIVHVIEVGSADAAVAGEVFEARLVRTDFKSFLYWREQGYPASDVLDAFGSAILRSAEGHVLLGRQAAGNINSGFAYLPGGFIDDRDVDAAGVVDIGASIARELTEETLLKAGEWRVQPGFRVIRTGPHVSMAREFHSDLPAEQLRRLIMQRIAAEADPELADLVIVRPGDAFDSPAGGLRVLPYTALALRDVFAAGER